MDEFDDFLRDQENIYDEEGQDEGEFLAPEIEMVPERAAFERAGIGRIDDVLRTVIGTAGTIPSKLEEINKRLYRLTLSDTDKFKSLVSIYFERFKGDINLNEADFSSLISRIDSIPKVKSLNPIGYILGYYLIKGNNIDKARFKRVSKDILPMITEVKEPDVIRYARLWKERLMTL